MDVKDIENSHSLALDFNKIKDIAALHSDVIPCVVQDAVTKDILIIGYVNQDAIDHTRRTGNATLWSTSRNEIWEKGKTSGDTLRMVAIRVNCEQNSILYLVEPTTGSACHTKGPDGSSRSTCFYRELNPDNTLTFLD